MEKCVNCGKKEGSYYFLGASVCRDCYKIVTHKYAEAQKLMKLALYTYQELLHAALLKGACRLPMLVKKDNIPNRVSVAKKIAGDMYENDQKESTDGEGKM